MLITLGSTSPVKIKVTHQAFEEYFNDVVVKPYDVSSGVNPFPFSETIQGTMNRDNGALSMEPSAGFSVGLEGGLTDVMGRRFVKQ